MWDTTVSWGLGAAMGIGRHINAFLEPSICYQQMKIQLNHHLERQKGCKAHLRKKKLSIPQKQSLKSSISEQFHLPIEVLSQKAVSPYPGVREQNEEEGPYRDEQESLSLRE